MRAGSCLYFHCCVPISRREKWAQPFWYVYGREQRTDGVMWRKGGRREREREGEDGRNYDSTTFRDGGKIHLKWHFSKSNSLDWYAICFQGTLFHCFPNNHHIWNLLFIILLLQGILWFLWKKPAQSPLSTYSQSRALCWTQKVLN